MAKAHCAIIAFDPTTSTVLTSAAVNVYNPGTVTPISATMFDKNGNTLTNPLTADATTGLVDFYLNVAQEVDLVISKNGFTTRTYSNVPVLDDAGNSLTALLTTTGDIVYASGNNTPARLAVGGANTLLHGGSTPSYSAVATADIAASAVTQNGFVQVSGQSTASTTFVSTSLALTLTTTGGPVLISGHVTFSNTGVNETTFALFQDGSNIDNVGQITTPVANQNQTFSFTTLVSPTAASHTFTLEWKVSAGTSTMTTGINAELTAIELKR